MEMSPQTWEASGGQNSGPDSGFAPGSPVLPVAIHEEHSPGFRPFSISSRYRATLDSSPVSLRESGEMPKAWLN